VRANERQQHQIDSVSRGAAPSALQGTADEQPLSQNAPDRRLLLPLSSTATHAPLSVSDPAQSTVQSTADEQSQGKNTPGHRLLLQASSTATQVPLTSQATERRLQGSRAVTEVSVATACSVNFAAISTRSQPGVLCFPTVGVLGRAEEVSYVVDIPPQAREGISFRVVLMPLSVHLITMYAPELSFNAYFDFHVAYSNMVLMAFVFLVPCMFLRRSRRA
jgi:hypothetical protein